MIQLDKKQINDLFKVVDTEYRNIIIGMEFRKRKIIELWANALTDLAYQVNVEYIADLTPVVRITLGYLRRKFSEYDMRQGLKKFEELDMSTFQTISKGINDLINDDNDSLLHTTFQLLSKLLPSALKSLTPHNFIEDIDEMIIIKDYVLLKTMTKDYDLNNAYREVYKYINDYGNVKEQFNKLTLDERVQIIDIIANAWNGHDNDDEISDLFLKSKPLFIPKLGIPLESGLLKTDGDGYYKYLETKSGIVDITKPLYKRYVLDRIDNAQDFYTLDEFVEANLKDINYFSRIKWGEI